MCKTCKQNSGKAPVTVSASKCGFTGSRSASTLTLAGRVSGCVTSTVGPGVQRRCVATKPRTRTHFYDLLGVSPKATQSEIKTAYYKLSKLHHPDINKKAPKGMFTQISEAYETLGNVKKRKMYDQGLNSSNGRGGGDDYTRPFREQEGFGTARRTAPTGRTHQYNFDEFYRQHYAESRRQEKADREYFRRTEEQLRQQQQQQRLRVIITGMMIMILCVVSLFESRTPTSRPRPPKDR